MIIFSVDILYKFFCILLSSPPPPPAPSHLLRRRLLGKEGTLTFFLQYQQQQCTCRVSCDVSSRVSDHPCYISRLQDVDLISSLTDPTFVLQLHHLASHLWPLSYQPCSCESLVIAILPNFWWLTTGSDCLLSSCPGTAFQFPSVSKRKNTKTK